MFQPVGTLLQTAEGILGAVIAIGLVAYRLTNPKNYKYIRRLRRKHR